jgi:hypothetical protein
MTFKINEFTRASCPTLRQAVLNALKGVEEQYGVVFSHDGGSFNTNTYTMKLKASINITDKPHLNPAETEKLEFAANCHVFGLTLDDYGKRFESNGSIYYLIGFKPDNRKYPIIGKSVRGARYKFGMGVTSKLMR